MHSVFRRYSPATTETFTRRRLVLFDVPVRFVVPAVWTYDPTILVELRAIVESYKAKEQTNQERFEKAEIERAKAARAEAFGTFS